MKPFFCPNISVSTETTDDNGERGTLFFDASCSFCRSLARRFAPLLRSRRFTIAPAPAPLAEILLVTPCDGVFGGAEAILHIARRVWWAFPLRLFAAMPGGRAALRRGYRWVAARRHCMGGACAMRRRGNWPAWMPLIALPALAILLTARLPAWVEMWAIAGAIFAGCKWLSWRECGPPGVAPIRSLVYLFLWPGMDAAAFLDARNVPPTPVLAEWIFAGAKTAFGAVLVCIAARRTGNPLNPLLAGWIGMAGLIFFLHFGAFHLIALGWQSRGIDAEPIMRMPIAARSLGDFWGRRWNRGFNDLAHRFVYLPVCRRAGAGVATMAAFLASGLVHEMAISVPARGGYGLPTLYFLIQGAGLLLERSQAGRRLGLRRGIRGRLFALIVAGAPAYWLFHPLFVARVIHPFLEVVP